MVHSVYTTVAESIEFIIITFICYYVVDRVSIQAAN